MRNRRSLIELVSYTITHNRLRFHLSMISDRAMREFCVNGPATFFQSLASSNAETQNLHYDLQLAVNQLPVHDDCNRFAFVDVIAINVEQILIQDNQVGLFTNLD